jgi:parallel beta-helix repeat protein
MTFWDGAGWIDDSTRPPRPPRAASRTQLERLCDLLATATMIAGLVIVVLPFRAAQASGPAISATPSHGVAGTSVVITGTSLPPRTRLQLTWDSEAAGMPAVRVTASGAIRVTIVVPASPAGSHAIAAVKSSSGSGATPDAGGQAVVAGLVFTVSEVASPADLAGSPVPSEPPTAIHEVAPTLEPTPLPLLAATTAPTLGPEPAAGATPEPTTGPTSGATPRPTTGPGAGAIPGATSTPSPAPRAEATPEPTTKPDPTPTTAPSGPPATFSPAPTPSPATTSTFYVTTSGSDAAVGSATAPWRTIAHAVANAPRGSTIAIGGGTYGPVAIWRPSLTLEPAGAASVTIAGGTTAISITASDVTIRGLRVTGATSQGIWIGGSTDVRIRNVTIEGNAGHGVQIKSSAGVSVLNSTIRANGKSGLRELEGTLGGTYAGNTIANNGHDGDPYNGDGVLLKGSGAVVRDNRIMGNGDSADYEHGIYVSAGARDYRIEGNVIEGNSASAIKASGGGTIVDNRLSGSPRGIVLADAGPIVAITRNVVDASRYAILVTANADLTRFQSDFNAFGLEAFAYGGRLLSLAGWQSATGLDLHST